MNPDLSARDYNNRGALLHAQGDLEAARHEYEMALDLNPDDTTALNNLAFLTMQLGDPAGAIPLLEHSLSLDPQKAMTYAHLGGAQELAVPQIPAKHF